MAELAADGHDLRRVNGSVYFWIVNGWLDTSAEVRGQDSVVPGLEGRVVRNRQKDRRVVEIRGQIDGSHVTPTGADAAFLALLQELQPLLFDRSADPWPLVAADGYKGLGVGETATISVRTINIVPDATQLSWRRIYSIELECVASPPDWVIV